MVLVSLPILRGYSVDYRPLVHFLWKKLLVWKETNFIFRSTNWNITAALGMSTGSNSGFLFWTIQYFLFINSTTCVKNRPYLSETLGLHSGRSPANLCLVGEDCLQTLPHGAWFVPPGIHNIDSNIHKIDLNHACEIILEKHKKFREHRKKNGL